MRATGLLRIQFDERRIMADIVKINLATKTGAKRALTKVAKNVMAQSQAECPRDTETLVNSAYIKQPVETANGAEIEVGYGGPNDKLNPIARRTGIKGLTRNKMASEYALEVHEDLSAKHPYGKAKFLEDPVRQHQSEFAETVGAELNAVLSRGITPR